MLVKDFKLHDVSDFPIVRLCGRDLPPGYGPDWIAEMEALLARGQRFALVFPNSAENEPHDDQKMRVVWLKQNKSRLAELCAGIFGVEPNQAARLLKRAQGLVVAPAFGLTFRVAATQEQAEALARLAVAGASVPDDAE